MIDHVHLLSGGLDSAISAYKYASASDRLVALSVQLNSDKKKSGSFELKFAESICEELSIRHHVLDISAVSQLISLIGNPRVTMGFGGQINNCGDDPMNASGSAEWYGRVPLSVELLHMVGGLVAIAENATKLVWSLHRDDFTPAFGREETLRYKEKFEELVSFTTGRSVVLETPFLDFFKSDILRMGADLGFPFDRTWSCSNGSLERHCGECRQCVKRKIAFQQAGISDPTEYTSVGISVGLAA